MAPKVFKRSCHGSRGPAKKGYDLRGKAPTPYPGINAKIIPQPVVNYLFAALGDAQTCVDSFCSGSWFAHWGTSIGAIRDQGLMPYDLDCDVAVVVDSVL